MAPKQTSLSPNDRARLRAETGCDERTIKAYPNVSAGSRLRLEKAAKALGIKLPRQASAA